MLQFLRKKFCIKKSSKGKTTKKNIFTYNIYKGKTYGHHFVYRS